MQQDQDFWSKILMIAVAFLIAAWVMFAWTMSTGLTWAGGRSNTQGRIANDQDRLRVKHIAVMTTVFATPVVLAAVMMKRRQRQRND